MEVEEIHHHPTNFNMIVAIISFTIVREEATFISVKLVRVQHIEHAYEYKQCKKDTEQNMFIQRGKVPMAAIPRSIAGPTVLAKVVYEKSERC